MPDVWNMPVLRPQPSVPPNATYATHQTDYVDRFYRLVLRWRTETVYLSQIRDMVEHPAFKEIVDMGDVVVPLIIKELYRQPDFLFLALNILRPGEARVPPAAAGKIDENVDAWLSWAERNGIDVS